ncbi:DUF72 domain-containing protein [Lichenicoccus sp.]|uniref:DUF72 domain-containing protein n=1 Tax=Lichenicoccus sp. TaxID=2781899 RepID=UPI003D137683
MSIRIGIGGWSYAPWRETFYPPGLRHADELAYAASRLNSLEINATFYRTQSPAIFRGWREAVPDGFVFSVKAARAAAQRREAAAAAPAIERFLGSGLTELGDRLGALLWQLPPTRKFDAGEVARFLDLLPAARDGVRLRHALEARHASFASPEALALLRERGVALVMVADGGPPSEVPPTADFAYLRLRGCVDDEPLGYAETDLDLWAERLRRLAERGPVFAYVIAGAKHRAPLAAMALHARILHNHDPAP